MSLATAMMTEMATRVLMVDDNAADRNLVRLSLLGSNHKYRLETADRLSDGLLKLAAQQTDIILLDLNLPDSQGSKTVQTVLHEAPAIPILVLTGADDDSMALEAVRAGAQDYIVKGNMEPLVLTRALRHAIERHRVLMTLRETRQKQLEFKDKFLSHVSHELRSPLACIHQYAELMLDGLAGPLTDKERDYLETVLSNAGQLNNLINDLLDAASASVGKLTIEPTSVQIPDVIKQLMQMFEPKAKAREVNLTAKVGNYLPPVLADRRRLVQVFINLLDNALKFTDAGGEAELSAGIFADDPTFVQFSVTDTGKGINPENLERIFDRLYQEQNAVSSRQGLGLGLAICKEVVKVHGGRIWVTSKPGKGSIFSFVLPMFSLPATVSPILVDRGQVQQSTVVAIEILQGSQTVSKEIWELTRRRCRETVQRCMLPDKDLLLPCMQAFERREIMFVLACADASGASVLERRILGQLSAAPQLAKTCIFKTQCLPLPPTPADKQQLDDQLEWISEKIEKAIAQASGFERN